MYDYTLEFEKLTKVVADPDAMEEEWLPACIVAGDRPLVPVEDTATSRAFFATTKLVAVCAIAFTAIQAASNLHEFAFWMANQIYFAGWRGSIPPYLYSAYLAPAVAAGGSFSFWFHFAFRSVRLKTTMIFGGLFVAAAVLSSPFIIEVTPLAVTILTAAYFFGKFGKSLSSRLSRRYVEDMLTYAGLLAIVPCVVTLLGVGPQNTAWRTLSFFPPGSVAGENFPLIFFLSGALPFAMATAFIMGPVGAASHQSPCKSLSTKLGLSLLFLAPLAVFPSVVFIDMFVRLLSAVICNMSSVDFMWSLIALSASLLEIGVFATSITLICLSHKWVEMLLPARQAVEYPYLQQNATRDLSRISRHRMPSNSIWAVALATPGSSRQPVSN